MESVRFTQPAPCIAQVVELVDTPVLEAGAEMRASSSLALGTKLWRVGRVVEGSGLLSRPPSDGSIGSNPILSAI